MGSMSRMTFIVSVSPVSAPLQSCPKPSTTARRDDSTGFLITHPFHPLTGQRFEVVAYAHTWGEHRVFFHKAADERVYSIPASWTDVEGIDPVAALGAGRAHFRVADLLALARVLDELEKEA